MPATVINDMVIKKRVSKPASSVRRSRLGSLKKLVNFFRSEYKKQEPSYAEATDGRLDSRLRGNDKDKKLSKTNKIKEIDGPKGLEPTRYGDWEVKGRLSDF